MAVESARLGRIGGGLAVGYAAVVGAIVAWQGDPSPPSPLPTSALTALLLAMPGAIALVASARRSRPLLVVAGVLCLLQSLIAFSGVTIPFVVPALVMLSAAAGLGHRMTLADTAIAATVTAGAIGAWAARLALTEDRCVPIPGGTSCGGGIPTSLGTTVAVTLAVATVAIAALAPHGRADDRR